MKPRYVISKALQDYTPEEYHAYVESLYKAPDTLPDSRSAKGIRLSWNKKGVLTIKCTRENKAISTAELVALALEYSRDIEELKAAFTKRSYAIVNEEGEVTNAKPKAARRGRAPKRTAAQRDAHLGENREQAARADQLFVSGSDTDLSA